MIIASIKDKEAWILGKEEEIAQKLYKMEAIYLPKELQAVVFRMAERDYNDTLADCAESRCKDETN